MSEQPTCPLCHSGKVTHFFQDRKNYQHRYHHCHHCDLVFVEPACRLTPDEEKARYDMHHNDDSEHYVRFLQRLAAPMLMQLAAKSVLSRPLNGLDFGSGRSQAMANLFRQQGHHCDCYDIFYYPRPELLEKSYDFIVASEVTEHLYDPKSVIEQWLNRLKPSGLLGIMTGIRPPDTDFPNWWYKNDPTHVTLFSRQTFRYLAANYGLTILAQPKNIIILQK